MRTIFRDCTVIQCAPVSAGGNIGSAVSVLGTVESADIMLKREFIVTTSNFDNGESSRAVRFGKGSVKLTGMSDSLDSSFALIFASSSHQLLQFTESVSGKSFQLICTCEDYNLNLGEKSPNKETLTLGQEGVPLMALGGGSLTAMSIDSFN